MKDNLTGCIPTVHLFHNRIFNRKSAKKLASETYALDTNILKYLDLIFTWYNVLSCTVCKCGTQWQRFNKRFLLAHIRHILYNEPANMLYSVYSRPPSGLVYRCVQLFRKEVMTHVLLNKRIKYAVLHCSNMFHLKEARFTLCDHFNHAASLPSLVH